MSDTKRLAIVGSAPNWKLCPFEDTTLDIWTVNDMFLSLPRYDAVFEMHKDEVIEAHKLRRHSDSRLTYWEALGNLKVPVVMQKTHNNIPYSVEFPLEKAIKHMETKYFTNSISYMLAFASLCGYKEIHIYGVNMAHASEYGHQKSSCEYFVGFLRGKGINIIIPEQSDLLRTTHLYGYELFDVEMAKIMRTKIHELKANIKALKSHELEGMCRLRGYSTIQNFIKLPEEERNNCSNDIAELIKNQDRLLAQIQKDLVSSISMYQALRELYAYYDQEGVYDEDLELSGD
jgi:hypothetical protein